MSNQSKNRDNASHKCGKCKEPVNTGQKGLECDYCHNWMHIRMRCADVSHKLYKVYDEDESQKWYCKLCIEKLDKCNNELREKETQIKELLEKIELLESERKDKGQVETPQEEDRPNGEVEKDEQKEEREKVQEDENNNINKILEKIEKSQGQTMDKMTEMAGTFTESMQKMVQVVEEKFKGKAGRAERGRGDEESHDESHPGGGWSGWSMGSGSAHGQGRDTHLRGGRSGWEMGGGRANGRGRWSHFQNTSSSKENGTYDDDRKRNIVIYNLPEGYTGTDEEYNVRYLFEKYLNLKDEENICDYNILHITRLGKAEEGKTRPLKVKLANEWEKRLVINRAKILQWTADNDISKRIGISMDLSPEDRKRRQELREELQTRRDGGETDLTIKNWQIVKRTGEPSIWQ